MAAGLAVAEVLVVVVVLVAASVVAEALAAEEPEEVGSGDFPFDWFASGCLFEKTLFLLVFSTQQKRYG